MGAAESTDQDMEVVPAKDDKYQRMEDADMPKRDGPSGDRSVLGGILSVVGGMMFHTAGGTQYCLGNIVVYMPKELKYWSPDGGSGPPDALLALPFTLIAMMITMPIGPVLEKKIGPKYTMMLGGILMGFGVFMSSFMKSLASFIFFYSFVFGCGVGTGYQMALLTGKRWFPNSAGAVVGCVVGAFGSAAFFFNLVDSHIINPEELNAVGGVYPAEIYERWPALLRKLGIIYAVLGVGGSLLQKYPPPSEPVAQTTGPTTPSERPLLSDIFSVRFLMMWLMIMTSATCGMFLVGAYKSFGIQKPALNNDEYLTLVGSVSSLLGNAGGRIFWGALSDAYGFKGPFILLTLFQGIFMISFKWLAIHQTTFSFATTVILFCMGGNYAMFPAEVLRKFGANAGLVYGVMFSGFTIAALVGPIVTKMLLAHGGYEVVFTLFGMLSFVATGLTILVPAQKA